MRFLDSKSPKISLQPSLNPVANALLVIFSPPISVKQNLKFKADVVVSECTRTLLCSH